MVNKESKTEITEHNCLYKILTIIELLIIVLLAFVMLFLNAKNNKRI